MRDGTRLLADIYRPQAEGAYPVLIAASPYPRQIQDLGAPMGFIEAGASDFFVPRGYVHVIANLRGTGGSGGTFNFMDGQERRDLHDLVEWAAAQPWSDGNVGMIGISYFAMSQVEAAVEQPSHLKAIFPVATTSDLYEAALHHGLLNSTFVSAGVTAYSPPPISVEKPRRNPSAARTSMRCRRGADQGSPLTVGQQCVFPEHVGRKLDAALVPGFTRGLVSVLVQ